MRKNPTPAELHLRNALSQYDLPVRDQEIVCGFIADFYYEPARLIIEVDGGYHFTKKQKQKDKIRDYILRRRGYSLIRFSNKKVFEHTNLVIKKICERILRIDKRKGARTELRSSPAPRKSPAPK